MNAKKFFIGFMPQKNVFPVVCLALVSLTNPIYAQTELGLIGGVNFSTLRLDNAEHSPYGFSSDKGFKAGAVLDIGLNRFLSLRMEPMWLQKGAILEQRYPEPHAPAYKSRIRLGYAELPVMFKISPFKGPVQPYLLAGGEAGYLFRATGTDMLDKNAESYDIKSDFKSFDYGVTYGGGIKLPFIGNSSFFIEGRHSIGLSDIGADSYLPGLKTSGVQVMAGVTFPICCQEGPKKDPDAVAPAGCPCKELDFKFIKNKSVINKYNSLSDEGKPKSSQISITFRLAYDKMISCEKGAGECTGEITLNTRWEQTAPTQKTENSGQFQDVIGKLYITTEATPHGDTYPHPKQEGKDVKDKDGNLINNEKSFSISHKAICGAVKVKPKKNPEYITVALLFPDNEEPKKGTLTINVKVECDKTVSEKKHVLEIDTNKKTFWIIREWPK